MFYLDIDPREETQANYMALVRAKLQAAYVQAKHIRGETLQSIADKLGVNKSVIYRQLSGEANLTVKTIADLSWALNKEPVFDLIDRGAREVKTSAKTSEYRDLATRVVFDAATRSKKTNVNSAKDRTSSFESGLEQVA
ncbi:hypothetical protein ACFZ8E_23525 [Methylobacterium sp. HMF5984]|uniref:hypothetical protein n=1 Tax=Methylobacterium sp. HMF5984 TaxID=3367370 RepID=UPI003854DFC1